jgi:hypothetical protein
MLTPDDLQQIGQVLDKKLDEKLEPINKRLDGLDQRLGTIEQDQSHMSTAIEALSEGQREIRETMATKADILDLGVKISKNHLITKARLENLEDRTGTHDPTKN